MMLMISLLVLMITEHGAVTVARLEASPSSQARPCCWHFSPPAAVHRPT